MRFGLPPIAKNGEHVLPRWLIEMTGDPKRKCSIPRMKRLSPELIEMAYDQLVVPACEDCNGRFSHLETAAKGRVERLLTRESLEPLDVDILLHWFDKVRIGMSHLHHFLDKGYWEQGPRRSIASMMGIADRGLAILRIRDGSRGLGFFGGASPLFQLMPTCFLLRIDSFMFITFAKDNLVARRMGFPYWEYRLFDGDGGVGVINPGSHQATSPIVPLPIPPRSLRIWQAIRPRDTYGSEVGDAAYGHPWVLARTLRDGASVPIVEGDLEAGTTPNDGIYCPPELDLSAEDFLSASRPVIVELQHRLWRYEHPLLVGRAARRYARSLQIVDEYARLFKASLTVT